MILPERFKNIQHLWLTTVLLSSTSVPTYTWSVCKRHVLDHFGNVEPTNSEKECEEFGLVLVAVRQAKRSNPSMESGNCMAFQRWDDAL
jgi:hypothetical protein